MDRGCRCQDRLHRAGQPLGERATSRASTRAFATSCSTAKSSTRSARPRSSSRAPRLNRIQATSTRGVRACIRRVAGCATPTCSAGHAGATANLKLTFHLDHSAGADHCRRAVAARPHHWRRGTSHRASHSRGRPATSESLQATQRKLARLPCSEAARPRASPSVLHARARLGRQPRNRLPGQRGALESGCRRASGPQGNKAGALRFTAVRQNARVGSGARWRASRTPQTRRPGRPCRRPGPSTRGRIHPAYIRYLLNAPDNTLLIITPRNI
jgi:hypothetical protein